MQIANHVARESSESLGPHRFLDKDCSFPDFSLVLSTIAKSVVVEMVLGMTPSITTMRLINRPSVVGLLKTRATDQTSLLAES